MRTDLSIQDREGWLSHNDQERQEQRFADYQPSPRQRWGWALVWAAAPWAAIFLGINVPAIWRHFFGA